MKKRILVGGLGVLLIIATIVTLVVMREASIPSNTNPALSAQGKHSSTPCPSTSQETCHAVVQSQVPPTTTPSPTPTQATPPTPIPTQITPPTPTVNSGTGNRGEGTSMEKQLAQQLFSQINTDRAAQGLPGYAWNNTLASGAYQHNIVMTTTSCGLLHQCPNEPTPCQRFKNEGITLPACAENIDYSYISAYSDAWTAIKTHTEQGMLAEQPPNDGHRKNLLSKSLIQIGISVLIDSQGRAWVTEDMTGSWP
jgi:uncharacterized protein YkwD